MSISETYDTPDTTGGCIRTMWITNVTANSNTWLPDLFPTPTWVRVWGRWVAETVAQAIRHSAQKASELAPLKIPPPYKFKAKSRLSFRMEFRWSAKRWKSNT